MQAFARLARFISMNSAATTPAILTTIVKAKDGSFRPSVQIEGTMVVRSPLASEVFATEDAARAWADRIAALLARDL